jgi:hypothetical protein
LAKQALKAKNKAAALKRISAAATPRPIEAKVRPFYRMDSLRTLLFSSKALG